MAARLLEEARAVLDAPQAQRERGRAERLRRERDARRGDQLQPRELRLVQRAGELQQHLHRLCQGEDVGLLQGARLRKRVDRHRRRARRSARELRGQLHQRVHAQAELQRSLEQVGTARPLRGDEHGIHHARVFEGHLRGQLGQRCWLAGVRAFAVQPHARVGGEQPRERGQPGRGSISRAGGLQILVHQLAPKHGDQPHQAAHDPREQAFAQPHSGLEQRLNKGRQGRVEGCNSIERSPREAGQRLANRLKLRFCDDMAVSEEAGHDRRPLRTHCFRAPAALCAASSDRHRRLLGDNQQPFDAVLTVTN